MPWVPEACTLPTADQPLRVMEFDELFATAVQPPERIDATGLRIHLPPGEQTVTTTRDLIDRETGCCSFFSFELADSADGTQLMVRVPRSHIAVLDAMHQQAETARSRGARA